MTRALFALILLVMAVLVTSAQKQCPKDQEWTDCGSPCKMFCSFRWLTGLRLCATDGTGYCFKRCRCKQPGYYYNNKLECVKEDQCEKLD